MAKVRIVLNPSGVTELLKKVDVGSVAADMAASAGDGFESSSTVGRRRALAMVWAETDEAKAAEARDMALTRALGSARR